tara:strand:- start:1149 stop:1325 length:177 start_codon:yes stop_codon:yes gene_type:complete
MKNRYKVNIPEVHVALWHVEAENEQEAIENAAEGKGTPETLTYSHSLSDDDSIKVELE